jgi:transcriptional regulator with XRE-family HTH domain
MTDSQGTNLMWLLLSPASSGVTYLLVTSLTIIAYTQEFVKRENNRRLGRATWRNGLVFPQGCARLVRLQRGDEKMNISARLRSLMQQKGMNLTMLAQRSRLAISSISRYRSGKQVPGAAALGKLAAALEVSTAELTGSSLAPTLSTKGQLLLQIEQLKDALLKLRGELTSVYDAPMGVPVPLYSFVPGSTACLELGHFFAPADVADSKAYAIRITDDFNSPRLEPGDVAVFSPDAAWKNGDACAVVLADGSGHIGRVGRRGKRLVLSGVKSASPSRTVSTDEAKAIHRLVWVKIA